MIPTPAHRNLRCRVASGQGLPECRAVITRESIDRLMPGVATRSDVLRELGDPAERLEADRFFVYRWEKVHGYFLVVIPYLGGGGAPIKNQHYLGLEFSADGSLKRVRFFDPWFASDARESVRQWMEEKADLADR